MNTSDARDLFSESPDHGWQPLSVQALAEDLRSKHPQITVLKFHAKGGMGAIYEGRLQDEKGGPISVAVKVLRPDAADDADYLRRFRREQDILASLGDHPHIVRHRLHGTTSEGYPFLVMDWVTGRSLVDFTEDRPDSKLTRQELLQIADDLCSAMQHAHEHQVLHRDLKPQNIIVTPQNRAVVLDFGIARSLRPGNTITQLGDSPGTFGYIAPEVRNGEKPDERADIYSLGIILYQLLMKELPAPFSAKPSDQSFDPRYDEIVMKAANPEREKRYGSAQELRQELSNLGSQPTNKRPADASAPQVSIEFDDDWIKINGVLFCSEPHINELTELLGEPEFVGASKSPANPEKPSLTYVWTSLGITAVTPSDSPRRHLHHVLNETREQRVSHLILWYREAPSLDGAFDCNVMRSPTAKASSVEREPILFRGLLSLCGLKIASDHTMREITSRKPGKLLARKFPDRRKVLSVGETPGVYLEMTFEGATHEKARREFGFAANSDDEVTDFTARPVGVQIWFEPWTSVPDDLRRRVQLLPNERILSAWRSAPDEAGIWMVDSVATTKRLVVIERVTFDELQANIMQWSWRCEPTVTQSHSQEASLTGTQVRKIALRRIKDGSWAKGAKELARSIYAGAGALLVLWLTMFILDIVWQGLTSRFLAITWTTISVKGLAQVFLLFPAMLFIGAFLGWRAFHVMLTMFSAITPPWVGTLMFLTPAALFSLSSNSPGFDYLDIVNKLVVKSKANAQRAFRYAWVWVCPVRGNVFPQFEHRVRKLADLHLTGGLPISDEEAKTIDQAVGPLR